MTTKTKRRRHDTLSMSKNASGGAISDCTATGNSSSVECPHCDDTFDTKQGMWSHKGQEHPGETTKVVKCDWCGDDITRAPSAINDHNFCSNECGGKWRSEHTSGEQSWHWKGGQQTIECEWCSSEFEVPPARADEARFCSFDCFGEWRSNTQVGEKAPGWNGGKEKGECDNCGSTVERHPSDFEHWDLTFCNADCRHDWLSENRSGVNSYSWEGGAEEYYGPNWNRQRSEARKRDGFECVICREGEESIGKMPDVHHIRKIKWFKENYNAPEWYEKGNNLQNLITLCRQCHSKWEGVPLRPDMRGE